ncbi:MAG: SpoIIE family protein phosphatase, partial [Aliifodinibius sp.]|nr:serine/threonine-protein phosphatase [Fodinibius sp.]NIV14904.1 SpoIIE family protein phosphatase [Fodinibius sp.]NIY28761.1 SpoIIE family protein phosphatase [Fodinibius sp.]
AMRAAMPAVFTSGLVLSRMKEDYPHQILSGITEPLFTRTDKRTFITCILARYDLKTGTMSIANAGHCRPILKRKGIAEYIKTPSPSYPLGLKEQVSYKSESLTMKKGDFFLLFSDGLPEAVNPNGERFGFDEVPRLIENIDTDNLSAYEIAQEIKRAVQKFSNYQLADDTTIICLKV